MKIAVDFDGTVVDHRYPEVGQDVPDAVRVLKRLVEDKHKIILYTMRSRDSLKDAIKWFRDRGIHLYGIQFDPGQTSWTSSNKCYAQVYIDDAALGCPMKMVSGFAKRCVDWLDVEEYFYGD